MLLLFLDLGADIFQMTVQPCFWLKCGCNGATWPRPIWKYSAHEWSFHRVTKYVKRFSVFAYSRMFVACVQTLARPLIYRWYVWRFTRNWVPRSVQHKHTAVTVRPSGPKPTGVDELPQGTSCQDIAVSYGICSRPS